MENVTNKIYKINEQFTPLQREGSEESGGTKATRILEYKAVSPNEVQVSACDMKL